MARYLSAVFFLLVGLLSASFLSATAPWAQRADGTIKVTEGTVPVKRVAPGLGNEEMLFWQSVEKRGDIADFQAYLKEYPRGDFADLAKNRLATLHRAEAETEVERTKAARRNEMGASERKNPKEFWATVTRQDVALLVSDTRPSNWPVFTVGDEDYQKNVSRLHLAALPGSDDCGAV